MVGLCSGSDVVCSVEGGGVLLSAARPALVAGRIGGRTRGATDLLEREGRAQRTPTTEIIEATEVYFSVLSVCLMADLHYWFRRDGRLARFDPLNEYQPFALGERANRPEAADLKVGRGVERLGVRPP